MLAKRFKLLGALKMLSVLSLVSGTLFPISSLIGAGAAGESITIAPLSVGQSQSGPVSMTLTGFDTTKEYIAVVSVSSGKVSLTSASGLVASPAYSAPTAQSAEISFSGTYANVAAGLATLQFHAPATSGSYTINATVTEKTSSPSTTFFWPEGNRYYEYVQYSAGDSRSWDAAKTAAEGKTLFGMTGYLATITSSEENSFIANKTTATNIWIGAGRSGTGATGDVWAWLTGPEAGKDFFRQSTRENLVFSVGEVTYPAYSGWASGEPNGSLSGSAWGEDKAVTNWNGVKGQWNDLIGTSNSPTGYLVEYGGLPGQTSSVSSATATPATITVRPNGGATPSYPTISTTLSAKNGATNRNVALGSFSIDATVCPIPEVTAQITSSLGTVSVPNTGVVVGGNNTSTVSVTGSPAAVKNALDAMTVRSSDAGTSRLTISLVPAINASVDVETTLLFNPANGHYYKLSSKPADTLNWDDALAAAEASTFCGVKGYLATIINKSENDFISLNALKTNLGDIWIGGKIVPGESEYLWVGANNNGPVSEYDLPVYAANSSVADAPWQTGEPNFTFGSASRDDLRLQLWFTASRYGWDDTPKSTAKKYLVEYGNNSTFTANSTIVDVTFVSLPEQTISWNPSNTSARVGQSPITPDSLPSSDGNGELSFSIANAGTTGCTVNSVTGAISFTASGECIVRASYSETDTHESSFVDVTFTFNPRPSSGSLIPQDPTPTQPSNPRPGNGSNSGSGGGSSGSGSANGSALPPAPLVGPAPQNPRTGQESGASVGGAAVELEATSPTPNSLEVTAGLVALNFNVPSGSGGIRNSSGESQLEVERGSDVALSGDGMLPGSTVQVWMPGLSGDKELGRVIVGPDGRFEGEVSFAPTSDGSPLPIGTQVIQLTGVDSNGDQTVINMTVNIAQPDPTPELFRGQNETPVPGFGNFLVSNAGLPDSATLTAVTEDKAALVQGEGWSMSLALTGENSQVSDENDGVFMTLVKGESAQFGGDGFMPGTIATIWLFSDPIQLGEVTISPDGTFQGETAALDEAVAAGEHTIQIQGVGEDGFIRSANIGVLVADPQDAAAALPVGLFMDWFPVILLGLLLLGVLIWFIAARRRKRADGSNIIPFPTAA